MNVQAILDRGRALALSAMVDTCSVSRPTRGALNETTGVYAQTSATVYSGACKVARLAPAVTDVAGVEAEISRPVLELPHGSADLAKGDVVTMTAGAMLGRVLTVVSEAPGSIQVVRRWLVDVVA